jgi:diguanylate cyclase (GGDEF)-like protein
MADAPNPFAGSGTPPPEGAPHPGPAPEGREQQLDPTTASNVGAPPIGSSDDYEASFLARAYRTLLEHDDFDGHLRDLAETAKTLTACERVVIERAGSVRIDAEGAESLDGPWSSSDPGGLVEEGQPSLVLPVITDGLATHVMAFYKNSTPGRFSPTELEHARRLGDLTGLILAGAARAAVFARLMRVEDGPAVATRNDFEDEVVSALASHGGKAGFMIVRISDLNAVNQRHGRDVGDEVLRLVARSLRETIGSLGTVGRIRRHEFGAVLPGETFARTRELAKELDKAFSSPLPVLGRDDVSATIAVGVAASRAGDPGSVAPLFHAAYTALERELGSYRPRGSRWS